MRIAVMSPEPPPWSFGLSGYDGVVARPFHSAMLPSIQTFRPVQEMVWKLNVTMLSVVDEALLVFPTGSETRFAAMFAMTVPELVIPLTATLKVEPLLGAISEIVTVFVPPAVPVIVT